jgi:hypothetical protein
MQHRDLPSASKKDIAACSSFYCTLITKAASIIVLQKWYLQSLYVLPAFISSILGDKNDHIT